MHVQPIVDLARQRVIGYEALARFPTAPIAPERWFHRAHQVGLGAPLEATALRCALERRPEIGPDQFLAVNVSPAALCTRLVLGLLADAAPLHGVVIELTEHDPMGDRDALDRALAAVRGLGGTIAIDDIGTGYAGLEWVLAVRPEMVKLDREFVRGLDTDEARRTFVRFVADLFDKLDTWLIAEGIETDGELEAVVSLEVPLAQGNRLAPPGLELAALSADLADQIARARVATERPNLDVAAHLERAPALTSWPKGTAQAPRVVLVDDEGRPRELLEGPSHEPVPHPLMRVRPGEAVRVVVQQALARPAEQRWAPLLVTDGEGRYQGIVRMERLVRALAEHRGADDGDDR